MITIPLAMAVILLIIFFVLGCLVGYSLEKHHRRDGYMTIDEQMGIASVTWEVPYEEVVQAKAIRLEVRHKSE